MNFPPQRLSSSRLLRMQRYSLSCFCPLSSRFSQKCSRGASFLDYSMLLSGLQIALLTWWSFSILRGDQSDQTYLNALKEIFRNGNVEPTFIILTLAPVYAGRGGDADVASFRVMDRLLFIIVWILVSYQDWWTWSFIPYSTMNVKLAQHWQHEYWRWRWQTIQNLSLCSSAG